MKKKVLGLDLGVSSIGWALIEENDESDNRIIAMGSRIVPLNVDDKDEFTKGKAISKNQKRTAARSQRKGYDRYQMRRNNLISFLVANQMYHHGKLTHLPKLELWKLRADAVFKQVTLEELGRVLLHINQKRGYKSSRSDANLDKKDTDYVAQINTRDKHLKDANKTIGQYFYDELCSNQYFRTKQLVFPRNAYIEEFDSIIKNQSKHYPELFTHDFIEKLRNEIIFYQRKLKSQKGQVSICDFEGRWIDKKTSNGEKRYFIGPKVTPRSSPLFQVAKVWETINNITIKNKDKKLSIDEIFKSKRNELFHKLNSSEKLSETDLFKLLGISSKDGWYGNKMTSKGIQGNLTNTELIKTLGKDSKLLELNLIRKTEDETEVYVCDRKTGEVLKTEKLKYINSDVEHLPLYKLWHTIYSIDDVQECSLAIQSNFNLNKEIADKLASIDFTKGGYSNKSAKAIRKTLPYLEDGYYFSEACSFARYNHIEVNTKHEQLRKELLAKLPLISKNSLRQPIVEKILNQLINVVNEIIDEKRGWVTKNERENNHFEIRIELARELKQSKDERNSSFSYITKRDAENKNYVLAIENLKLKATRTRIQKYRLFFETSENEHAVNSTCLYCGKNFGLFEALSGDSIDVEHIIPKSKLFDDSQSNKILTHRKCNSDKGDKTAYDYMRSKGDAVLDIYLERINKIPGRTKRTKLLASLEDFNENTKAGKASDSEKSFWEGFIDRQLRESQYIAKKAVELLNEVSINVWLTSGNVTAYLRDRWGWDDVTMNLQLPKYKELGLTEMREWETNDGQKHKKEIITGWTKRDDHRHHAIDALVIACTKQSFIQRLNTLSSQSNREEMFNELGKQVGDSGRISLIDRYVIKHQPFKTIEVEKEVAKILVSFKAGKKTATLGSRKINKNGKKIIVQRNIIVPRGALSEESVYGKIKTIEKNKAVKFLLENHDLIINEETKNLVIALLNKNNQNIKECIKALKITPLVNSKNEAIEFADCYKYETVLKYPVTSIKPADIDKIVDEKVKKIIEERLKKDGGKIKDIENNPVWFNEKAGIKINTVRKITGVNALASITVNDKPNDITYEKFVKPGNNHHIAIYKDVNGDYQEHSCTFWDAVERKKYQIPVLIKNTTDLWNKILVNPELYPQDIFDKLPQESWEYVESMQQNEMFVLGLDEQQYNEAVSSNDLEIISKHLYRVQKIATSYYVFRHHLETNLIDTKESLESKRYLRLQSFNAFFNSSPKKMIISNLGELNIIHQKINHQINSSLNKTQINEPTPIYQTKPVSGHASFDDMENDQLAYNASLSPLELLRNLKKLTIAAFGFKENQVKPERKIKFNK